MRVAKARDSREVKYVQNLEKDALDRQRRLEEQRLLREEKTPSTPLFPGISGISQERHEKEKAFLAQCTAAPVKARSEIVACLLKNDYDGALVRLAPLLTVSAKLKETATPAEKNAATAVTEWANMMQQGLQRGARIYNDVYNGGEEMAGTYLEVAVGELVAVKTIRRGIIDATSQTGSDVSSLKLDELPTRVVRQLANKAAKLIDDDDAYYFFLITQGLFSRNAPNLSPNDAWRKEYPLFAVEYFKQQLKTADDRRREEMEKQFGILPEFREAIRQSSSQQQ